MKVRGKAGRPKKYATDEERREARKAQFRKSKRKARGRDIENFVDRRFNPKISEKAFYDRWYNELVKAGAPTYSAGEIADALAKLERAWIKSNGDQRNLRKLFTAIQYEWVQLSGADKTVWPDRRRHGHHRADY